MDTFLSRFCQRCGATLPVKDDRGILACKGCNFSSKMTKVEEYTCVEFEHPWLKAREKATGDDGGPTIDRACSKCGHGEMTYTTQQLRSADEGQTVFYRCTKCNNQEVENS